MSDASLEKTTATIDISNSKSKFIASGEVLLFDGFLRVYFESSDDEGEETTKDLLPPLKAGDKLDAVEIIATERFTQRPPRYTEASLVKKLEELGIGRPSTYAPTISTILARGYVVKDDRDGVDRKYQVIQLKKGNITENQKVEVHGAEKSKLFPSDIGMVVNDFLVEHFPKIVNFNFTASVEKEFDDIAMGNMEWTTMIDRFYKPFHKDVEKTLKESDYTKGERILGKDPKSGKPVLVRIGRFGPIAQIGESEEKDGEKPKFASLLKGQLIESITLEDALELFKLPRTLGDYEGKDVVVGVGRFGPYVRHNSKFVSLKKTDDPITITIERAIELIEEGRQKDREKYIKVFENDPDTQVLNGRWGPFIKHKGNNYKIPKGTNAHELTHDECLKIVENQPATNGRKGKSAARKKSK
jgi:DNA topoisomerase-1